MKEFYLSLFIGIFLFISLFDFSILKSDFSINSLAGAVFSQKIKTEDVVDDFKKVESKTRISNRDKIKIMIVPGHDNENSGAIFGDIKEAELNLKVAERITDLLNEHKEIEVLLARNEKGYNKKLNIFFENEAEEILEFRQEKVDEMNELIEEGKIEKVVNIQHNFAKPEIVKVLYGINKYANDEDFDIVLHIHFNDYPGRIGTTGKYSGFAIYVPEKQFSNSEASYDFALKLSDQLKQILPVSNMPKESDIVESQELIAIGANNTSETISVLVEYGYIYESYFTDPEIQPYVFDEIAKQTYWGVMNYLRDDEKVDQIYDVFYDFDFEEELDRGSFGIDVFSLQTFLRDSGYYPFETTLNKCPMNGYYGPCTEIALQKFQEANDLNPNGILDKETINKINPQYLFETIWE
jgi:N-acetylmuramoyl-L-alanine amidase